MRGRSRLLQGLDLKARGLECTIAGEDHLPIRECDLDPKRSTPPVREEINLKVHPDLVRSHETTLQVVTLSHNRRGRAAASGSDPVTRPDGEMLDEKWPDLQVVIRHQAAIHVEGEVTLRRGEARLLEVDDPRPCQLFS